MDGFHVLKVPETSWHVVRNCTSAYVSGPLVDLMWLSKVPTKLAWNVTRQCLDVMFQTHVLVLQMHVFSSCSHVYWQCDNLPSVFWYRHQFDPIFWKVGRCGMFMFRLFKVHTFLLTPSYTHCNYSSVASLFVFGLHQYFATALVDIMMMRLSSVKPWCGFIFHSKTSRRFEASHGTCGTCGCSS